MVVAAAPAWFADNLLAISAGTLAVLTVAVLRMVHAVVWRVALLVLVGVAAVAVYANRTQLEACARTCSCSLAGRTVTVPTCQRELDL